MFEGESVSVQVKGAPEDRRALSPAPVNKNALSARIPLVLATVLFGLTVTFGRDFLYNSFEVPFAVAATMASIAGLLFFLLVLNVFGRRRVRPRADSRGLLLGSYTVTAAPDGLHIASQNSTSHFRWAAFLSLNETDTHLILHTDAAQAIIVPKRCFSSKEEASRFAIIVRSRLGGA